jgi:hypothetical protein
LVFQLLTLKTSTESYDFFSFFFAYVKKEIDEAIPEINKKLNMLMLNICVMGLFLAPAYAKTIQNDASTHNAKVTLDLSHPSQDHTVVWPIVHVGFGHFGTCSIDGTIKGSNDSWLYPDSGVIISIDPSYGNPVGHEFVTSCNLNGTAIY